MNNNEFNCFAEYGQAKSTEGAKAEACVSVSLTVNRICTTDIE